MTELKSKTKRNRLHGRKIGEEIYHSCRRWFSQNSKDKKVVVLPRKKEKPFSFENQSPYPKNLNPNHHRSRNRRQEAGLTEVNASAILPYGKFKPVHNNS
jgi:hypothetical protein